MRSAARTRGSAASAEIQAASWPTGTPSTAARSSGIVSRSRTSPPTSSSRYASSRSGLAQYHDNLAGHEVAAFGFLGEGRASRALRGVTGGASAAAGAFVDGGRSGGDGLPTQPATRTSTISSAAKRFHPRPDLRLRAAPTVIPVSACTTRVGRPFVERPVARSFCAAHVAPETLQGSHRVGQPSIRNLAAGLVKTMTPSTGGWLLSAMPVFRELLADPRDAFAHVLTRIAEGRSAEQRAEPLQARASIAPPLIGPAGDRAVLGPRDDHLNARRPDQDVVRELRGGEPEQP